jgi:hypothetical protein
MNNIDKEIPTIDLKLETKEVKSETRKLSSKYMVIEPPYFLFSEHGKEEIVKIWTKNKKKIILWYLYKITRIDWFIKKYNEQHR